MSNFFKDIEADADKVESDLLGPSYKYYKHVVPPSGLGMSSEGSLDALERDASGLIDYVELLVSGTGKASTTRMPLGDQYFLRTGAKCTDVKTGNKQTRYIYINNIPTGNIPFISEGLGMDFPGFKGLIPSVLQDMGEMNPLGLFKGFMAGEAPKCQELTMFTTPSSMNKNKRMQTKFVTQSDIKEMDPCTMPLYKYINPISGKRCREAFSMNESTSTMTEQTNDDYIFQLYICLICSLIFYIIYRSLVRHR
jgi:hypothetical protein